MQPELSIKIEHLHKYSDIFSEGGAIAFIILIF